MNKVLLILGVIAVLGVSTPVMASSGHVMHGGADVVSHRAVGMHRIPPAPPVVHHVKPHSSITFYRNYPRHSYRCGCRLCSWGDPWCDYRLGWCDDYYRPCKPLGGFGVNIRF